VHCLIRLWAALYPDNKKQAMELMSSTHLPAKSQYGTIETLIAAKVRLFSHSSSIGVYDDHLVKGPTALKLVLVLVKSWIVRDSAEDASPFHPSFVGDPAKLGKTVLT
jgi:hypothetical protein